MLHATIPTSTKDLQQILQLQQDNLIRNLDEQEMKREGFVTIQFSLGMLEKLHDLAPSIIIRNDNKIVAYAIVLLQEGRMADPSLEPMFLNLENIFWKGKLLYDYRFYIMGQICIDKLYRGKGLFEMLYQKHKEIYQHRFDFIVTEISARNHRSLSAHQRVGFKAIHSHVDALDEWSVVLWDWK